MRIVLDATGGDHAPAATVHGAILAARTSGDTIVLLGPQSQVKAELARHDSNNLALEVIDAPETIAMDAHPAQEIRRKPHSAHAIGLRMVRDGQADAFVSAGNSGATMAGATLILGRNSGVERPALATLFPAFNRPILVLDVGATTDCKPGYLLQFAQLGSHYARQALGIASPRVALLANGEEATKGDKLVQEAHTLLKGNSSLNFVGNAEPKDALVNDLCDVLVCDGFVGNIFIKTAESTAKLIQQQATAALRQRLPLRLLAGLAPTALLATLMHRSKRPSVALGTLIGGPALIGAATIPPLLWMRRRADYRSYGGAPLLGLKGVAIIAHGRSDGQAIAKAIEQAHNAVISGAISAISLA